MLSNAEIRQAAREHLSGRWTQAVLVTLIYSVIFVAIGSVPFIGGLISFLLAGPFILGLYVYFLGLVRKETVDISTLFSGFNQFIRPFLLYLLTSIFIFLWTLLLIVPGIIASLRYAMAYFILHDHPEMTAMEAIQQSKVMMEGHKGRLFMLFLSFIGWFILCIVTFGIGILWLNPYICSALAAFYQDIKGGTPLASSYTSTDTGVPL